MTAEGPTGAPPCTCGHLKRHHGRTRLGCILCDCRLFNDAGKANEHV